MPMEKLLGRWPSWPGKIRWSLCFGSGRSSKVTPMKRADVGSSLIYLMESEAHLVSIFWPSCYLRTQIRKHVQ
eukprot:SAG31_NODE_2566_length_5466_cov_6.677846_4_plen_73_part_00